MNQHHNFCSTSCSRQYWSIRKITKTISENNINISKIIQKDTTDGTAEIVIVTHPVVESEMKSALEQLVTDKLSNEILSTIRVGIN